MRLLTNVTKYAKKAAAIAMAAVMLVGLTACSSSSKEKERNLAPEAVAEEALLSLTNTDAKTAFEDVFGWDELAKAIQEKGYKATIELSIEDIPGDMIGLNGFTIPSAGIVLEVSQDSAKSKTDALIDLQVANVSLLSAEAYMDSEKLLLEAPKLYDGALMVELDEEFVSELQNAALSEMLDEETMYMLETLSAALESVDTDAAMTEEVEKFVDALEGEWNDFLKALEAEKEDTKEIKAVDGKVECDVYEVTFGMDEIGAFLTGMLEETRDYLVQYEDQEWYYLYDIEDVTEEIEYMIEDMDYIMDELSENTDEITMTLYVKEQRPIRMELDIDVDGEVLEVDVTFASAGALYDNIEVVLNMDGEEMTFAHLTENTSSKYESEWMLEYDGEKASFVTSYDKKEGDFALEFNFADEITAGLYGELEIPSKGKSFSFEFNHFEMYNYGESMEFDFTVGVALEALSESVSAPSGSTRNVLTMTESDWEDLAIEIQGNLESLIWELIGVFE